MIGIHEEPGPQYRLGHNVEDTDNWNTWPILYPQYIDAGKTRPKGRKISLKSAVTHPTLEEMGLICQHFEIPYVLEFNKTYSRDILNPGRIRAYLKAQKDDQEADTCKITSKKILMHKMGELIPQLKTRTHRSATLKPSGPQQASTASKKKKNKKNR